MPTHAVADDIAVIAGGGAGAVNGTVYSLTDTTATDNVTPVAIEFDTAGADNASVTPTLGAGAQMTLDVAGVCLAIFQAGAVSAVGVTYIDPFLDAVNKGDTNGVRWLPPGGGSGPASLATLVNAASGGEALSFRVLGADVSDTLTETQAAMMALSAGSTYAMLAADGGTHSGSGAWQLAPMSAEPLAASAGMAASTTTELITVTDAGDYFVLATGALWKSSGAGTSVEVGISINGAGPTPPLTTNYGMPNGDQHGFLLGNVYSLTASQTVGLQLLADSGTDIGINTLQLIVVKVTDWARMNSDAGNSLTISDTTWHTLGSANVQFNSSGSGGGDLSADLTATDEKLVVGAGAATDELIFCGNMNPNCDWNGTLEMRVVKDGTPIGGVVAQNVCAVATNATLSIAVLGQGAGDYKLQVRSSSGTGILGTGFNGFCVVRSPVAGGAGGGSGLLHDEDDLVSDDDTKGATQQSVKAYVDAAVASVSDARVWLGPSLWVATAGTWTLDDSTGILSLDKAAANNNEFITCDISAVTREAASKGLRLDSIEYAYSLAVSAVDDIYVELLTTTFNGDGVVPSAAVETLTFDAAYDTGAERGAWASGVEQRQVVATVSSPAFIGASEGQRLGFTVEDTTTGTGVVQFFGAILRFTSAPL